jgi:hypothetical protein
VTEAQMLRLGLSFIGVDEERTNSSYDNKNRDRFTKAYGVSPLVCSVIFGDLQVLDIGDEKISKPKPKHFLLCMFWLKRYQVESILSERFRHSIQYHKIVFEAECVITQYNMENGHPLFEI